MNIRSTLLLVSFVACLFLPACGQRENVDSGVNIVRLFDIFEADDLAGNVSLATAGWERTAWQASEMASWQVSGEVPSLGFRGLRGLTNLELSGNALTSEINGSAPVLQFALGQNRGGAGPVKYVDVRMRVSGASQVWLRPEGAREIDDSILLEWAESDAWHIAEDVAKGAVRTYRFDVSAKPDDAVEESDSDDDAAGVESEKDEVAEEEDQDVTDESTEDIDMSRDLRNFFLTFRDCDDASISISSIRFISEKEEKLNEPSGQKWAGLAEVYRETLATKTSETIRLSLRQLPARPWLDIAIGTDEDSPVTFTATIANREGSKISDQKILFERSVTVPDRWEPLRIDLADYAGESVLLELSLSGEKKGLWGYWGAPVVRNSVIPEPRSKKPRGVIFIVADTLRTDHLNIYGYERETVQHLKTFADEGVAFSNAIAQGTWTKVSQSSMMTSLYPVSHGVMEVPDKLPASAETIAEVYREAGYATVSYSSVMFTGKQNNLHQGYEELHEKASISDEEFSSKTSSHYVDRIIPWLEQHKDVPFFACLHVFDPHSPYRPRPPYDTIWGRPGDKERWEEIEKDIKEHDVKNIFGLPFRDDYVDKTGNDPDELLRMFSGWYDGSIRGMDAEMGRLLKALKEMGIDDDTLIVFSSDHGEELWEHGRFFHSHTVYGELSQVPLMFRWPGNPNFRKGGMVDRVIENLDIMPTLLELSGIEGPAAMQGRSLVPLIDGSGVSSWQDQLVITHTLRREDEFPDDPEKGHHFSFIENGLKVIRKEVEPELVEELFDRSVDRLDLNNIIGEAGRSESVGGMTKTFDAWRAKTEAQQLPDDGEMTENLSSEEIRRLQALGYVGGGVEAKGDDESDN
ncbi:sulfatase-like hydrolase/transferase [bacterium]|nr:sulfatase-like hydrolase/transferase [bacterium]